MSHATAVGRICQENCDGGWFPLQTCSTLPRSGFFVGRHTWMCGWSNVEGARPSTVVVLLKACCDVGRTLRAFWEMENCDGLQSKELG